jgi:hypothetical protein
MAIGWLTVLKAVPWSEVITNAPKVAEGARKLWNSAARKSTSAPSADSGTPEDATTSTQRIAALENSVGELQQQLVESSALIQTLAEQNTQLVKHIEANRQRVAWLAAATALSLLAGLGSIVVLLTGIR